MTHANATVDIGDVSHLSDDFDYDDNVEGALRRLDRRIDALRGLAQLLRLIDGVHRPDGTSSVSSVPGLVQVLVTDLDRCRDDIWRVALGREP